MAMPTHLLKVLFKSFRDADGGLRAMGLRDMIATLHPRKSRHKQEHLVQVAGDMLRIRSSEDRVPFATVCIPKAPTPSLAGWLLRMWRVLLCAVSVVVFPVRPAVQTVGQPLLPHLPNANRRPTTRPGRSVLETQGAHGSGASKEQQEQVVM